MTQHIQTGSPRAVRFRGFRHYIDPVLPEKDFASKSTGSWSGGEWHVQIEWATDILTDPCLVWRRSLQLAAQCRGRGIRA
jgi:hypothetical protein